MSDTHQPPHTDDTLRAASDAELLDAWRGGHGHAGSLLIQRHAASLYKFFANKVGPSAAEDLCQQALEACVLARDRIEDGERGRSFRSYLFGVARAKLIDYYRRIERHNQRIDPLQVSVADLTGGLSCAVARRAEQRRLIHAMHALPLDAQIVLELHYWQQLRVMEIADVLGSPPGTIKARLSRARSRLLAALESDEPDPASRTSGPEARRRWPRCV